MTTIRDIAREAGVSVSTVSRVITGKPDVSARTAQTVQKVIDSHHFTVNRNARYLKQTDTATFVAIVKGRNNLLFASMLETVQETVTAAGRSTVIRYIDEDEDEVAEAERLVPEYKPEGVVFLGGDPGHFEQEAQTVGVTIPAVVLTNQVISAAHPLLASVATDDVEAGRMAALYLVGHGHRNIGVIGGNPQSSTISRHRLEGVDRGLRDAGLNLGDRVVATRYSLESGYEAATQLIDSHPDVTAVYAMSDIMALGAMRAFHDLGRRVPEDVSILGHDGIDLGRYVVPQLTTIRQPGEQMARRGVEILIADVGGEAEFLDVELVEGESVATIDGG